jgi:taurine dioxygenase
MANTVWADDWPFEIAPLSPLMAAEITGFDAAQPIDDLTRDSVLEALGKYKVLVLRDQNLAPSEQAAFTKRFGELEPHVNREFRGAGVPEVHPVNNFDDRGKPGRGRNIGNYSWHTDKSYMPRPSLATFLYAVTLPPAGGDTEFADMQAAYGELTDARQLELAALRVVHSWERSRQKNGSRPATAQEILDAPPVVHPLIRTHPMTSSKGLYLGNHSSHVEGWSTENGETLLQELQDFATQVRFVYRHHWRPGDMVIWDNCALLHRALANYDIEAHARVLNRTVVRGSVPI